MLEKRVDQSEDYTGNFRTFLMFWGLPIAAMVAAIWIAHPAKTLIWVAALLWMGSACLVNAWRCGRTHCFYTGPFFLLMTVPVLLHGYQVLWLGPDGWKWLALVIGIGGGGLWCFTEKLWGRYRLTRP